MQHAVIVAHPSPNSLTLAVAAAYAEAVCDLGQTAVVRDLYDMGFDPCLKAGEIPKVSGYQFAADVLAERRILANVDVFAFIYPFWFNAPPAILKGYVDRVFSMGFGYEPGPGGTTGLLDGRRLISFTSSGAPEDWVRDTGAMRALTDLFDNHLARVCGLRVIDHVHTGGITPETTRQAGREVLKRVSDVVRSHFSRVPEQVSFGLPDSP